LSRRSRFHGGNLVGERAAEILKCRRHRLLLSIPGALSALPIYFSALLIFILIPLIEIALLVSVGQQIGVYWTLVIVVGTAILGTALLRAQGFGVLARMRDAMALGKMPLEQVVEGVFLLLAGAFLLTPGLITDAIGFILLVPVLRIAIARFVLKRTLLTGVAGGSVFTSSGDERDFENQRPGARQPMGDGDIIDGEYERVDEPTKDPDRER